MSHLLPPRWLAMLAPLALGWACQAKPGRHDQCVDLAQAMGPHTEAIDRDIERLAQIERDPKVAKAFRSALAQADRELAVLQFEDPKLAGFALAYRRQLAAADKAVDELAAGATLHDPTALYHAARAIDRARETIGQLLTLLDTYCSQ